MSIPSDGPTSRTNTTTNGNGHDSNGAGAKENGASDDTDGLGDIEDAATLVEANVPHPPVLIEGIVHQTEKIAIGGDSKSYKTWNLLNMAISVSHGLEYLGRKTTRGRVLIVNLEVQRWAIRSRLEDVAEARGVKLKPGWLHTWNLRGKATDYQTLLPKIRDRIKQGYVLVILDPIYKIYGNADENKAGDISKLLNAVEDVTVQSGAATAFAAHFSKGNQSGKESIDRISGSGVFARDPDTLLIFTKHEESNCFIVEPTVRNFPPAPSFVVKWKWPLFELESKMDPTMFKRPGPPTKHSPDKLLALLPLLPGGLSNQQWEAAAAGAKPKISHKMYYKLRGELEGQDRAVFNSDTDQWQRKAKENGQ